jgi:hypothetical protein
MTAAPHKKGKTQDGLSIDALAARDLSMVGMIAPFNLF